jgi:hypothetical protein
MKGGREKTRREKRRRVKGMESRRTNDAAPAPVLLVIDATAEVALVPHVK